MMLATQQNMADDGIIHRELCNLEDYVPTN